MYDTAVESAKNIGDDINDASICSWLRYGSPDALKDGAAFEPDMRIPRGSVLEQQLGESYTQKINQLLRDSDYKDTVRLWAKYADQFFIKDGHYSGTAVFKPGGGIHIDIDAAMAGDGGHRPGQNLFHESGHMLDWLLGMDNYRSAKPIDGKSLVKTLNEEAEWLFRSTQSMLVSAGKPATRMDVLQSIAWEIQSNSNTTDRNVEDMLQAALGDDYPYSLGHDSPGYFREPTGTLQATEAFAEMLDAQLSNPEAWNLIVTYFPVSVKLFTIMIQEALA